MKQIRVLIVDGVSTTRQTLQRLLDQDRELEVVGAVASGRLALSRLNDLCPDLVLLDVALPELEGLQTLAALRKTHPTLPVIMFSSLTQRGSQTTVDALLLGASDYVTRPTSNAELERCMRSELIAKIKSLASRRQEGEAVLSRPRLAPTVAPVTPNASVARLAYPCAGHVAEIVAIATSTGGPSALASLLSSLPPSFSAPIVVVQHMASGFTGTLAESLCRQTGRNVREVQTTESLNSAAVWIAPGGRHLVVKRQGAAIRVAPHDDPPENGCCPSADVLFRSVVDAFGSRCLAVVLTGMGNDGLAGCRAIRRAGGTILVQDEASSIAWGMPGHVATAGLADVVLPLADLPQEICRRTTIRK
ncbi:MAG: chemotaxis-specific protein-glutamate methyltransferase CheB [Pirellulales bacterium]